MSLSTPTQLLIKNIEQLSASTPLVVNCPDPDFAWHYQQQFAASELSFLFYDFTYFQAFESNEQGSSLHYGLDYQPLKRHDLLIIYFPKSKAELAFTLHLLAKHLEPDALVFVVGENNGGIKSLPKLTAELFSWSRKDDSARRCSLYSGMYRSTDLAMQLTDWFEPTAVNINQIEMSFYTLPGVFCHQRIDKGTQILLENLPADIHGRVLDFGCGGGVIGSYLALRNSQVNCDFVDINALALESTKYTLRQNNLTGSVWPSDSLKNVSGQYDTIVANPPFHQGLKTHYAATEHFLNQLKSRLNASGNAFIVANSFLNYKTILTTHFSHYQALDNRDGFTIHFVEK